MNADGNGRMPLQDLDRFLIPRRREHHRHRYRHAGVHEPLEAHVHRVAHPRIVTADDETHRLARGLKARRTGSASHEAWRVG